MFCRFPKVARRAVDPAGSGSIAQADLPHTLRHLDAQPLEFGDRELALGSPLLVLAAHVGERQENLFVDLAQRIDIDHETLVALRGCHRVLMQQLGIAAHHRVGRVVDRRGEFHRALLFGKAIGRWSETVDEGTVLRSDPPVGQTLRPGTVVDLFVSKGRKPLTVSDWTGKDADEARAALERKDFDVATTDEYSDTVPEGDVISQSPSDGTLFRGEEVALVVSLGPELVEVPGGLVASGWEAAQESLEAAGFVVDIQHIDNYLGLGFVYSVDPGSGQRDPQGVHGHPLADLTLSTT